jgi:hypothetical protein
MVNVNVYLDNHYGATIKFKKGTSSSDAPEIALNNQERTLVGMYPGGFTALSIRTTGTGSSYVSYFTQLDKQIEEIRVGRFSNKGKDAIIIIKPSKSYQSWNIEVRWEGKNQTLQDFPSDLNAEYDLAAINSIMNGSLGQDYAEKARAINDYDYTKSTKRGQINLKTALLKKIKETETQTYTKYHARKEAWTAPELSSKEDLKNEINRLYRALEKYKEKDNQ